jgi:hypothetical protein
MSPRASVLHPQLKPVNGETETFSSVISVEQRCPLSPCNIMLELLPVAIRQEKEIKDFQIERKK